MKSSPRSFLFFLLLLVAFRSYGSDPITGTLLVCVGSTTTLSNATPGGTWSTSTTAVGTIDATSGVVTGIALGTMFVTYTFPTTGFSTEEVTVNPLPDAGVISGATGVCDGSNTTLTNTITGGVWSSSDISIATVGSSSGVVTGVDPGTATITYTITNGCGTDDTTETITVNPLPDTITGTSVICNTTATTLADASTGGTWSSTSTRVTVGSATGIVTGVLTGTAIVSYALPTGCRITKIVTVNLQPSTITGSLNVCVGANRTLTNSVVGGTWSSSNSSVANIGTAGVGIVSGISADTARITYTLTNGCYTSSLFTVNPVPGPITGTFVLCAGTTTILADPLPGGTWSSSVTGHAVISVTTAVVQAYNAGTTVITYKTTGGCTTTTMVTVLASPAVITGTLSICDGANTQLHNTVSLGSWSSSDTSVAILVTPTGLVGGLTAGTSTISYTLGNGCYRSAVLTVNPLPDTITGPIHVCTARSVTLTSGPSGGTWTSSNLAKATVGTSSGIVTGVATGTVVMTYKLPTTCKRTMELTVNPSPAAIAGTLSVCEGLTTGLSSSTSGGTWTSSNTSIATVASVAGVVSGMTGGVDTIAYTIIASGCSATASLTVNSSPAAIVGASSVCGGGATTTLTSTTTGGTWSSGTTAIATVGSADGIVSGVAAGTVLITYRLPTGCIATHVMTVTALPYAGIITGAASVCETGNTTLLASVPGGTWSSALGLVSVTSVGFVTGLGGGIDTIKYSVTDGCGVAVATYPITINPLPDTAVISGSPHVCVGLTSALTASLGGGIWSNGSTTAATVSGTGVVSGVVLGTATISYTRANACGSSVATVIMTVHALVNPGTITGKDTTCMGDSILLAPSVAGGAWISSSPWIASVNGAGRVFGLFYGTTVIKYVVSNVCSVDTAFRSITVRLPGECVNAVHEPARVTRINTYPNPTNGVLTIETPVAGRLTVYTIDGREVQQYKVNATTETLTLPRKLAPGVYMCRFTGNDGSVAMVRVVYEP